MKEPRPTLTEQLTEVEGLLEDFRWSRSDDKIPEHKTFLALKALALDLRARLPGKAEQTRRELGRRIADAVRAEHAREAVAGVGEALIGAWPLVEQALEHLDKQGKENDGGISSRVA
jgi:hypothetical protein